MINELWELLISFWSPINITPIVFYVTCCVRLYLRCKITTSFFFLSYTPCNSHPTLFWSSADWLWWNGRQLTENKRNILAASCLGPDHLDLSGPSCLVSSKLGNQMNHLSAYCTPLSVMLLGHPRPARNKTFFIISHAPKLIKDLSCQATSAFLYW